MSQKKTTTRKQRSNSKRKITEECEGIASQKLQNKVWKSGKQHQTTTVTEQLKGREIGKDRLQNKTCNPRGIATTLKTHDLEITNVINLGSLM